MTTNEQVEQLKIQGNTAFSAGKFEESITHFTAALELEPTNHILWSNRSASYASLCKYDLALADADQVVSLRPEWAKGHGRRGSSLMGLGRLQESRAAYSKAVELDPENMQLKKGLEAVEQAEKEMGDNYKPVDNPFSDPMLWDKLNGDAKMREYLKDPEFVKIMEEIKKDPKNLTKHIGDPRITKAFSVMLGVDLEMSKPTKADEQPSQASKQPSQASKQSSEQPTSSGQPIVTEAAKEKELGNEAYKKRDFEKALSHYAAAGELDPENISILTNKSAVYFEMGNYEKCIELCQEAVTKGRENYADFKVIAKALGRIGSCHEKTGNIEAARDFYQKSLTEHRTADILTKFNETQRLLEIKRKTDYHNPEIAEQERNIGNDLFKKGDFAEAVKHYTEAIKRDEADPRAYSNRAACYMKLAAVPEGIKDCDKAIQLDPTFIKAHIRRAHLLHLRRDYSEALTALNNAAQLDDNRHTSEIQALMSRIYQDMRGNANDSEEQILQRAMQNPEVREILNDPVMMQILKQMQSDPKAVQEHFKNPEVALKLRKLIAAGVIKTS